MSSTYLALHFHLVFATKNLEPLIAAEWQSRLHEYLGGTINGLGGFAQGIGGIADHVHLLVGMKATHCLSDFMRKLKKASSAWIHDEIGLREFRWQEGYAAFTVSPTARSAVKGYIARQPEHHRTQDSRTELAAMLKQAGIEFDVQYFE